MFSGKNPYKICYIECTSEPYIDDKVDGLCSDGVGLHHVAGMFSQDVPLSQEGQSMGSERALARVLLLAQVCYSPLLTLLFNHIFPEICLRMTLRQHPLQQPPPPPPPPSAIVVQFFQNKKSS